MLYVYHSVWLFAPSSVVVFASAARFHGGCLGCYIRLGVWRDALRAVAVASTDARPSECQVATRVQVGHLCVVSLSSAG